MPGPYDGAQVLLYVNMSEAAQAALTVGLTNSAFTVTANDLGTVGNSNTIAVVVPAGANVAGPTVSVSGSAITVTTGTGATAGTSNSTSAAVRDAINTNPAAKLNVTASLPTTSNGTGFVAAAASAPLTGGAAAGAANYQPIARQQGLDLEDTMDSIDANSKGDRFAISFPGRQSGSFELSALHTFEDGTQARLKRAYQRREEVLVRVIQPTSVTGSAAITEEALCQLTGYSRSFPDSDVATISAPLAMKENWRTV